MNSIYNVLIKCCHINSYTY